MIRNEVTTAIMERRSIRKFKPDQLSEQQLSTLLECGFLAPSGGNSQNWFVTVVQSKDYFKRLTDKQKEITLAQGDVPERVKQRFADPNYSVSMGAPTVLFVAYEGPIETNAALLSQNIVLTAQSLGLGTCYLGGIMGFFKSEAGQPFVKELGLPDGYNLLLGIAVGTPDEAPEAKPRDFTKVHYLR